VRSLVRRKTDELSRLSHGLSDLECCRLTPTLPQRILRFTGSAVIEWFCEVKRITTDL
jgi:hypothetical protein